MNRSLLKITTLVLVPAALLFFASCSSTSTVEKTTKVAYKEGVPGGVLIESYQTIAKVAAVDPASKKVILLAPDGNKNTFTAGPKGFDFAPLHVGDTVKASVTRQLVVYLNKDGPPPIDGETALPSRADHPRVLKSDTVQRSAKVGAINLKHRHITLQFPDGTSATFEIRKDVDLSKVKLGDDVVIRTTSAVTLAPEKSNNPSAPTKTTKPRN